ncbi:hypothetical protein M899_1674 [Bacteriovorax sp. BSW11_IV]|uniref:SH3 domain-containing protein n=1 Tax=Bacteriovorax sp. BSW11_IV TaxID=1353529 RepID=UPI00038A1D01|nr:SH3 domain-containing protein [Bacteriovorax sp. BSW11_IV]EQC49281.1 hypothetical protein M899_1674 [Bacteriovorax sp. BSW11_IV]
MDQIDEFPLGGRKLGDILTKNEIKKPSSGLSKLLGQAASDLNAISEKPQENAGYPDDQTLHNEFLRLEREKNDKLTQTISDIQSKIEQMSQAISANNVEKELLPKQATEDKKPAYPIHNIIVALALLVGIILGATVLSTKEKTDVNEIALQETKEAVAAAPVEEVKKIETTKYVTTKFANMRDNSSPEGALLKTITPNQVLELVEQKGGWLKVRYKDLVEEKSYEGWIWYELLKKLN